MASTGRRRTAAMRDMQLNLVITWLNQGWTAAMMAKELDLSVGMIHKDIQEVERRWRMETRDYRLDKNREIAAIDAQITELWMAWEASKTAGIKKTVEQYRGMIKGKMLDGAMTRGEEEARYGDPSIMAQITKLRELKIKLLGLNDPIKVALTDTKGNSIFPELTDDDIQAAISIIDQRQLPAPGAGGTLAQSGEEADRLQYIDAEFTDSGDEPSET